MKAGPSSEGLTMKILVLLKMVPDIVGELEIGPGGRALDFDSLRMVPNDSDEHALEEALLLKERHGGSVTVLALDAHDLDDVLLAALAKGADRAIKITGVLKGLTTSSAADVLAKVIDSELGTAPADLILCGVQAIDDLDGLLAPLIACQLGLPFLGTVVALAVEQDRSCVVATMEYPNGVAGEFEVTLPAVFGIRAAEKPPRYVSKAKLRSFMTSHEIECIPAPLPSNLLAPSFDVLEMRKPQLSGHAEMLEGSVEEVSARLTKILVAEGYMRRQAP